MRNHNTEKTYYECLAKLILENVFPNKYHDIKLEDRPDLVNFDGSGIEVTRAMYEGSGEASRMFQIVKNKTTKTADPRALKKLDQLGYNTIRSSTDQIYAYVSKNGIWVTTKELEISYRSKIRKLNQYGYNTDLFIFGSHHFLYEKTDIEKFVELINASAKENEYKFNRVFIYQYRKLYNCDISDRKVMMVNMDSNTVDLIMKEAYEFSK